MRTTRRAQVCTPHEVQAAMAASATSCTDASDDTVSVLTDFYAGLFLVDALVRRLLPLLEGSECKSPEKGKFTLAFRCVWVGILAIHGDSAR